MKRNLLGILFALIFNGNLSAQIPLIKQWDYRYGGTGAEQLFVLRQTTDGGYILGGHSASGIGGDKTQSNLGPGDYWIVKTDALGIKQWDKTFGGLYGESLFTLQQTIDGGYILGGSSTSGIGGDKTEANRDSTESSPDFWIIKTDSLGNKQWDKTLGGSNQDYLFSLEQTSDRGYILGGASYSGISGDKTQPVWGGVYTDYWIVKIDSLGNKQWDKDFGGTNGDLLLAVSQTSDAGFILAGLSISGATGDKTQPTWGGDDYWIVKTDSLGNKQWDMDFGGTNHDDLHAMDQTPDGGFILGGWSFSGIGGDKTQDICGIFDYWIVKTDSQGNKQWDMDYGGNEGEQFFDIVSTNDGGYFLSGYSDSDSICSKTEANLGNRQTWIVKTDSLGNTLWDKTIFTTGIDVAGFAIPTNDGCYVIGNASYAAIGGYKSQPAWNNTHDFWFVKLCDSTSTTSIEQVNNSTFSFSFYPNPARNILTITLFKNKKISILNLYGETIIEKNISANSNSTVELDISSISPGIYFIKVDNEVKIFVKE